MQWGDANLRFPPVRASGSEYRASPSQPTPAFGGGRAASRIPRFERSVGMTPEPTTRRGLITFSWLCPDPSAIAAAFPLGGARGHCGGRDFACHPRQRFPIAFVNAIMFWKEVRA